MNIDTLLHDTFAAHEDLAPDADDVLAAAREGIARRRSGLAKPLAVAASAVLVAATATGAAVALNRHSGHGDQAAQQAASRSHVPTSGHPSANGIAPLTMPYDLGWLPAGSVAYLARRINVGAVSMTSPPVFGGEYLLTVTTTTATMNIDVQQQPPGELTSMRFKSGPGVPVTIADRDGIESSNSGGPGGYEVYFSDGEGVLMYVNAGPHTGSKVSAAELTAIGRRIAANVRFPGRSQVRPTFNVGYVPAGLRVRGFNVESGSSDLPASDGTRLPTTSYDVGTSTRLDSVVDIATYSAAAPSGGTAGRRVQGHPTRYVDHRGYSTLRVLNAVNGQAVAVSGRVSLSELYKVADGLVLPK